MDEMTPSHRDTLYCCWNGRLQTATFIREDVAPGAIERTWLVRETTSDDAIVHLRPIRVSRTLYARTAHEAYQRYLNECVAALFPLQQAVVEAQKNLKHCEDEIERVRQLMVAERQATEAS